MNLTSPNIPLLRLPYSEPEIAKILQGVEEVLRSGYLTMSRKVEQFEQRFAEFCQTRYAVGTNSGTSALEMALRIIGVQGKEVLMPSNTYMATALAAIKAGAKVRFVECERENLQMDFDDLQSKINEQTAAVVLVHIAGIVSPKVRKIEKLCSEQGLALIEDAAHAHGANFDGQRAGSFGLASAFSFYPTKVLTCAEGGMLCTDDPELYAQAKILREHGKTDHRFNRHSEVGDNWRFSEIHAVLGLQQMDKAEQIIAERQRLAALYDSLLQEDHPYLHKVSIDASSMPSYYKYVLFLDRKVPRAKFKQKMLEYGVQMTGEVYDWPCHKQPLFEKYPHYLSTEDSLPITDAVCASHICPPLYPGLEDCEVEHIVQSMDRVSRDCADC